MILCIIESLKIKCEQVYLAIRRKT